MSREQELLQIILEMRELARLQVRLAEQEAEAVIDWKALDIKLSGTLKTFGVAEYMGTKLVPLTKEAVTAYLDSAIVSWRWKKEREHTAEDRLVARCYVDAFQSARLSLFGEMLPIQEEED